MKIERGFSKSVCLLFDKVEKKAPHQLWFNQFLDVCEILIMLFDLVKTQ